MPLKERKKSEGLGWALPMILTGIWFAAVGIYLNLPWTPPGGNRPVVWIEKISALDPSQFGDFLSGAFAPVAFFWLAYSVLIQKAELKLTREVMKEQEAALKSSSESNQALAEETKNQNIIEKERLFVEIIDKSIFAFYESCKKRMEIRLNDGKNQYGFDLGYTTSNGDKHMFDAFEIALRAKGCADHIRNYDVKIVKNEHFRVFIGFVDMIGETAIIADSSKLGNAIFVAQGFGKLNEELQSLKKLVTP